MHPMEGTHAGTGCEELKPVGRIHAREVSEKLSPMGRIQAGAGEVCEESFL